MFVAPKRAASSAPTAALDAALVSRVTLLATVFALAAAILVDVPPTPPRAHRVAPAAPSRRAYPNWTDEDQEALVDRELHWRDRGMSEDTRVYASMLVRHNIVPEQVLFEAGCSDYQDERAFPVLAQAAENLMRVGCDSTDDDAD